jgi:hypothetical protein
LSKLSLYKYQMISTSVVVGAFSFVNQDVVS